MGKCGDELGKRLREYLLEGGFRVGDTLPGEREIATSLGVGRTALRPCLDALEAEGVIERRPQSGTVLTALPARHACGALVAIIAPLTPHSNLEGTRDAAWLHRVISAFERIAVPAGARVVLRDQSPLAADPCSVKDLVHAAITEGAGAVVLVHPLGSREKIACALGILHDHGVHPVIVSSRTYPGLANQIYFDSGWGSYLATRYLIRSGHTRIGFVGGPIGNQWVRDRLQGYRDALETAEIAVEERRIWMPDDTSERPATADDGAAALAHFAGLPRDAQPTAVVAANDVLGVALLHAAARQSIAVPGEISVIGFDNDAEALVAGLTTVERPTEALGEAIARTTLERLAAGPQSAAVSVRLRPVLIERSTVGPPPGRKEEEA